MRVALTIGSIRAVLFVSDRVVSPINANKADANGISRSVVKLIQLAPHVAYDSIDLLNHRFLEEFSFDSNFHGCNHAARNMKSGIDDGRSGGHAFSESSIAATRLDPSCSVLTIYN